MRIEPFDLGTVRESSYDAIFGDLHDVIDHRLVTLVRSNKPRLIDNLRTKILNHLKEVVDSDEFALLQNRYVTPEYAALNLHPNPIKYLDLPHWILGKLNATMIAKLHETPPKTILDLGVGCGHFPFIASYFGHRVVGTDIELSPDLPEQELHLYDAICKLLGIEKLEDHKIEKFTELPDFGERFDMVSALMTNFNINEDGTPWSVDAWRFFLTSLSKNCLKPGGKVLFLLTNGRISKESWEFLVSQSVYCDERSRYVLIRSH